MNNLKNNKAAGPDKLKAELFKELGKRQRCREVMLECFNSVLGDREVPDAWRKSRTVMVKKGRRPTVKDFRPIAITDVSYKIFMAYIREKIEEHIERNNMGKDNQVGFTGGGRIEYNHMMLQYVVEKTMEVEERGMIIMLALDFQKAFDSLNREEMVKTLIEYKIDPRVIDLVVKIYTNDETIVRMGEREEKIEVGSGIRQGCTASTTFFKLVTYEIMRELEERGTEFRVEDVKLLSLFFADDSILIARDMEAAIKNLNIVKEVGKKFGLVVNVEKSKS